MIRISGMKVAANDPWQNLKGNRSQELQEMSVTRLPIRTPAREKERKNLPHDNRAMVL